jgi:hypothetical protein
MNTMMATTMIYVRSYFGGSYASCCSELNLPPVLTVTTQTHLFHLSDGLLDILEAVKTERFMRRLRPSVT